MVTMVVIRRHANAALASHRGRLSSDSAENRRCYLLHLGAFIVVLSFVVEAASALSSATTGSCSNDGSRCCSIPRVEATQFNADLHYYFHQEGTLAHDATGGPRHEQQSSQYYETPVLISGALSAEACERICDDLVSLGESLSVEVQRQQRGTEDTVYSCTLGQAIDLMMHSRRGDAVFIFAEGLLERLEDMSSSWRETLTASREDLFHDQDWFQYFPESSRPTDCVVLAGEGAQSTLHRDPFEWTGTSLCLEGSKIWRFIQPPQHTSTGIQKVDRALESYRLASMAWDDETNLSAGWQSDLSLYSNIDETRGTIRTAQEWSQLPEDVRWKEMQSISVDCSWLQPNIGNNNLEIWSGVQRPGDLLLIPAHWWHQTYALEPSVALASQRCGTVRDAPRVLRHILTTTGAQQNVPEILRQASYSSSSCDPQATVDELFTHIEGDAIG